MIMALRRRKSHSPPPERNETKLQTAGSTKRGWPSYLLGGFVLVVVGLMLLLNTTKQEILREDKIVNKVGIDNQIPHPRIIERTPKFINVVNPSVSLKTKLNGTRTQSIITVDKEVYRPGDTMFVRVLLLDVFKRKPLFSNTHWSLSYTIVDPMDSKKQGSIRCVQINNTDSCSTSVKLDDHAAGGDYIFKVAGTRRSFDEPGVFVAPSSRRFQVRLSSTKSNNKLGMHIDFEKQSYGIGDYAIAHLKNVTRLADGLLASGSLVTWRVTYQGGEAFKLSSIVDAEGQSTCRFKTTEDFINDSVITATVIEGSAVESVSKSIPIIYWNILVETYPEGGVLVPGHKNRVFVLARDPNTMEPVDITAEIIEQDSDREDCQGAAVAPFMTYHEGRGVSGSFLVKEQKFYKFCVISPALKVAHTSLDNPVNSLLPVSATITVGKTNFFSGSSISVDVQTRKGSYKLTLTHKERTVATVSDIVADGRYQLSIPEDTSGVLGITLYSVHNGELEIPVAERLVFSKPLTKLHLTHELKSGFQGHDTTTPGETVEIAVQTFTEDTITGKRVPIAAFVSTRVTDISREDLIESRKKQPSLVAASFLQDEVNVLFDAESYMYDGMKMDLLLCTQGWRRMAYSNVTSFLLKEGIDDTERMKRLQLMGLDTHEDSSRFGRPMMRLFKNRGAPEDMVFAAAANMEMAEADALPMAVMMDDVMMDGGFIPEPLFMPPRMDPMMKRRPFYPLYDRVYSHVSQHSSVRNDFQETLYFNPGSVSVLDGDIYSSTIKFDMSDSITRYRCSLDAYSFEGFLGTYSFEISSNQPLTVDVKLPALTYVGDSIWMPVAIESLFKDASHVVELALGPSSGRHQIHFKPQIKNSQSVTFQTIANANILSATVRYRSSLRMYIPLETTFVSSAKNANLSSVTSIEVSSALESHLRGQSNVDKVSRHIEILSHGFPMNSGTGGTLSKTNSSEFKFDIPKDVVEGSIAVRFEAYPSPVGQILGVIASLLREPCGCFEQTSSTTYPMILALKYLVLLDSKETVVTDLITKTRLLLTKGYFKLASYETSTGGFEWFGESPGHEALTSYGLLQFTEMANPALGLDDLVDPLMLKRTQKWLLERRDGFGQFKVNPKSLDSFGRAPHHTTSAYILWSLAKAKVIPWAQIKTEIQFLLNSVKQPGFRDPYIIALSACILFDMHEEIPLANQLLETLVELQNVTSGAVTGNGNYSTITSSNGVSKRVEATSVAMMAWVRSPDHGRYASHMAKAARFIGDAARKGTYGSTQATALGLEAIIEYTQFTNAIRPSGELHLSINQESVYIPFQSNSLDTIQHSFAVDTIPSNRQVSIQVRLTTDESESIKDLFLLPFMIDASFLVLTPPSHPNRTIEIQTSISADTVTEGEIVSLEVSVRNTRIKDGVPMTVVKVGYPAGTEPRVEKLQELQASKTFSFYEVQHGFVTFYWRGFGPQEIVKFTMDLVAVIPGRYTSPASQGYIYYDDAKKHWVSGSTLQIVPLTSENVF